MNRVLVRQSWLFGDRMERKGNPFEWVDGPLTRGKHDFSGIIDLNTWYKSSYEEYPTKDEFKYENYEKDFLIIQKIYQKIFDFYFPFLSSRIFS